MCAPVVAHGVEVVLQPSAGRAACRGADLESCADGAYDLAAQVVLVGEVPVERGRLDPELAGQPAQGERLRPVDVHERDRLLNDVLAGQARTPAPRTPA